jgi:hypothetical protein
LIYSPKGKSFTQDNTTSPEEEKTNNYDESSHKEIDENINKNY